MGTFERIRKISPYALVAFAVIFVAFMVASDADIANILRQGTDYRTAALGKVNGEKILYRVFEEKVREQVEQQRKQSPEQNIEVDENQIRKSLWNQMVDEILQKQEAEQIGIKVTDDEILDIMLDNPPDYLKKSFTDSAGNFQRQTYIEIMTNPDVIFNRLPNTMPNEEKRRIVEQFKSDILRVEQYLREEKLQNSLRTFISIAGSFVSPLFAREKYINDNASADVRVVFLDVKEIPDKEIKITDEEIKKYYNDNKQFYPEKPKRKLKYSVFKIVPSHQDTVVVDKKVRKMTEDMQKLTTPEEISQFFEQKFRENNGEISDFKLAKDLPIQLAPYITTLGVQQVVGPIQTSEGVFFIRLEEKRQGQNEVVKASHILIGFGMNKDSALASAKEILAKAKKGEDFAELARKFSEDKGSGMNGGDLGYFGKGMMVKPFEEAAFKAKVGEVVGPVESQFGYHIIKVFDKKSEEFKYSFIKFAPEVSRTTLRLLNRDAKLLKEKVEGGVSFDSAAKEFNVTVRQTDFFERSRPTLGSNYLTALAFESKVGAVLEPLELKNQGIVVAQIIDERKKGFVPLEDLKDKIKLILTRRKQLDILAPKAKSIYEKVKNLGTLENAKQIDPTLNLQTWNDIRNNGFVPGVGQDWGFTAKVFQLPVGKIFGPFRGERGYYIIEVLRKSLPDENLVNSELKKQLTSIISNFRQSAYIMWFNKLKEEADIEDFRTKFYRDY